MVPGRQKMIGLFKATKCARDDDFLDSFLSPEKSTFKFIMMGTREQDYLKVRVLMRTHRLERNPTIKMDMMITLSMIWILIIHSLLPPHSLHGLIWII